MPSGSCVCGEIQYTYTCETPNPTLCHCTRCQKWGGGPGSLNLLIPNESFEVTRGETRRYYRVADSGRGIWMHFCGNCGTSLWGKSELLPEVTFLKASTVDDAAAREKKVLVEVYCRDRWAGLGDVPGAEQKFLM